MVLKSAIEKLFVYSLSFSMFLDLICFGFSMLLAIYFSNSS